MANYGLSRLPSRLPSYTPTRAPDQGVGGVRFGFFTDVHSADKDPSSNRYYRDAAEKMTTAIATFNAQSLDFVMMNGDLVDGSGNTSATITELNTINDVYETVNAPRYYNSGNHDYEQLDLSEYVAGTGMASAGYYYFDKKGIRFIVLDANYSLDDDASHYDTSNFDYQDTYVPPTQRTWLTNALASAPGRCVIFCHQLLMIQTTANYVKNADAVRTIIEASGKVLAVFMGHAHINDYWVLNGIPYYVMQAMCEGADPLNAYAVVTIQ